MSILDLETIGGMFSSGEAVNNSLSEWLSTLPGKTLLTRVWRNRIMTDIGMPGLKQSFGLSILRCEVGTHKLHVLPCVVTCRFLAVTFFPIPNASYLQV